MRTLFPVLFGIAFLPFAAAADHSAIHTIEQQIAALQVELTALVAQQAAPARVPANPFAATLRRGSRGEEVRRLQEFLATMPEFYPEGLATGTFGPATERAVKRFQKTYGIPAIGVVGPQTRAKLNELLTAKAPPPPAPLPAPVQAPEPAPAPPPPQAPALTPPAPLTPPPPAVPLPMPADLGVPSISFAGWGASYLSVQFTHDPGTKTRSYIVAVREPDRTVDTVFGPLAVTQLGAPAAAAREATLKRIGLTGWEWRRSLDLATQPEGTYQVFVRAVGDGAVEGFRSSGRATTLYAAPKADSLLQDAPLRDVVANTVTRFPLTIRLLDGRTDLYHRHNVLDGETSVWESGYITATAVAQAVFTNANGYEFRRDRTYRIRVDVYDNNTGADSVTKAKPTEITFGYAP